MAMFVDIFNKWWYYNCGKFCFAANILQSETECFV